MTHAELVPIAGAWLGKKCPVVITEIATMGEEPDAIGWRGSHSTLVECKATRADFLSDRTKAFRRELERGIGQHRYYLTPKGLLEISEVPPRWGLLEFDGGKVKCVRESENFDPYNHRHEVTILLSTLRRLGHTQPKGCSIRFYTIESKNRASVGVELEAAP